MSGSTPCENAMFSFCLNKVYFEVIMVFFMTIYLKPVFPLLSSAGIVPFIYRSRYLECKRSVCLDV